MKIIDDYNLPDCRLMQSGNSVSGGIMVWRPEHEMIIIGKGSKAEEELIPERIDADMIKVIRRDTGGCAVILSPRMIVVSLALKNDRDKKNNEYFHLFDHLLIKAFEKLGVKNLQKAGYSDIILNGLKVVGSSIYRNKDIVFFHAVINLAEEIDLISRYLKVPHRQPEYRQNRDHADFVTSFEAQGYEIDPVQFEQELKSEWLWHFNM